MQTLEILGKIRFIFFIFKILNKASSNGKNLAEEFRKIIDSMSDEELERKLKELEPLHNVGPKADDYLEFLEETSESSIIQLKIVNDI